MVVPWWSDNFYHYLLAKQIFVRESFFLLYQRTIGYALRYFSAEMVVRVRDFYPLKNPLFYK